MKESSLIPLYNEQDFVYMRRAGSLAASVLDYITPFVKEGVTTESLDSLCYDYIVSNGARAAPLNYRGYPKSTCISLNHVICHGIPGERKLRGGDILNIDVTVELDGWYGDTSRMFYVGDVSAKARRLVETTFECLWAGISAVRPGATVGDIGHAIETLAHRRYYSVVEEFCGHGIGRVFHDVPNILHFGIPGEGPVLEAGMIFTIEPMINGGKKGMKILSDNWTAVTKDRSLSAQFEHTLAVTPEGYEVFTLSSLSGEFCGVLGN